MNSTRNPVSNALWRRVLTLGFALALIYPVAPQARAHEFSPPIRIPNASNINFNYQDLTNDFRLSTDWNINNNFHPRSAFGTINVVVNSVREINVLDSDYSPLTWSGFYECGSYSNPVCYQANVHYNLRYAHPESARRWLGCHEIGHAWGIDHNENGCMSGTVYNSGQSYGQHNIDHIEAWY